MWLTRTETELFFKYLMEDVNAPPETVERIHKRLTEAEDEDKRDDYGRRNFEMIMAANREEDDSIY